MGAPSRRSRRLVPSPFPNLNLSAVGHSLAENPNFPPSFSTLSRTFSSFLSGFVIGISLVSEPKKEAFLRPEACPQARLVSDFVGRIGLEEVHFQTEHNGA